MEIRTEELTKITDELSSLQEKVSELESKAFEIAERLGKEAIDAIPAWLQPNALILYLGVPYRVKKAWSYLETNGGREGELIIFDTVRVKIQLECFTLPDRTGWRGQREIHENLQDLLDRARPWDKTIIKELPAGTLKIVYTSGCYLFLNSTLLVTSSEEEVWKLYHSILEANGVEQ